MSQSLFQRIHNKNLCKIFLSVTIKQELSSTSFHSLPHWVILIYVEHRSRLFTMKLHVVHVGLFFGTRPHCPHHFRLPERDLAPICFMPPRSSTQKEDEKLKTKNLMQIEHTVIFSVNYTHPLNVSSDFSRLLTKGLCSDWTNTKWWSTLICLTEQHQRRRQRQWQKHKLNRGNSVRPFLKGIYLCF